MYILFHMYMQFYICNARELSNRIVGILYACFFMHMLLYNFLVCLLMSRTRSLLSGVLFSEYYFPIEGFSSLPRGFALVAPGDPGD